MFPKMKRMCRAFLKVGSLFRQTRLRLARRRSASMSCCWTASPRSFTIGSELTQRFRTGMELGMMLEKPLTM